MILETHDPASPMEALRDRLATIIAIPVTPFQEDGSVDWDNHAALIRRLVEHGVDAITPNGNTGEFYTLTEAETRRSVESAVAAAGGGAAVMAGVGLDVESAVLAARHARGAGADAVMVHQPVHPYRSVEGWIEYHRNIADAVPELGVVLYVRDPRISGEQIRALGERSPNVIGVKYAVPDPVRFAGVARDAGLRRFVWIAGLAELSAPGYWAVGATGFTSGLVNVAPGLATALLESLRRADYARAMTVWESARTFEELRAADASADNVSVVKEALAHLGLSGRAVRPPSRVLPQDLRERIAGLVGQWRQEGWL
ncbi:4-hydroxy-tetrahydrodipicolinate synthase [Actinacidiphila yanglinensis]|uniref:4-hydroxy-tetrahydrodipicolinate synthase n=1 Tax=Actinacidiphila yanglinensis TaxID=310779 RepID=A0A1H6AK68_9ACTN|nr:dihydrodipicolinate synthase family protein [Actinacidiphila yanglinensis]SEG48564.1 4-hydroxy-tetrahydrodipicolinate synthase [Actinacidiphila yanglinensis]